MVTVTKIPFALAAQFKPPLALKQRLARPHLRGFAIGLLGQPRRITRLVRID